MKTGTVIMITAGAALPLVAAALAEADLEGVQVVAASEPRSLESMPYLIDDRCLPIWPDTEEEQEPVFITPAVQPQTLQSSGIESNREPCYKPGCT